MIQSAVLFELYEHVERLQSFLSPQVRQFIVSGICSNPAELQVKIDQDAEDFIDWSFVNTVLLSDGILPHSLNVKCASKC